MEGTLQQKGAVAQFSAVPPGFPEGLKCVVGMVALCPLPLCLGQPGPVDPAGSRAKSEQGSQQHGSEGKPQGLDQRQPRVDGSQHGRADGEGGEGRRHQVHHQYPGMPRHEFSMPSADEGEEGLIARLIEPEIGSQGHQQRYPATMRHESVKVVRLEDGVPVEAWPVIRHLDVDVVQVGPGFSPVAESQSALGHSPLEVAQGFLSAGFIGFEASRL